MTTRSFLVSMLCGAVLWSVCGAGPAVAQDAGSAPLPPSRTAPTFAQALAGTGTAAVLLGGATAVALVGLNDCPWHISFDDDEPSSGGCIDGYAAGSLSLLLATPFLVPAAVTLVGDMQGMHGSYWGSLAGSLVGALPGALLLGASTLQEHDSPVLDWTGLILAPVGAIVGSLLGYRLTDAGAGARRARDGLTPSFAVEPRGGATVGLSGAF